MYMLSMTGIWLGRAVIQAIQYVAGTAQILLSQINLSCYNLFNK